jgi:hypothetical protein
MVDNGSFLIDQWEPPLSPYPAELSVFSPCQRIGLVEAAHKAKALCRNC